MKKYKIKIKKPNAKYAGSLIQQNHGETLKKGYLVWSIKDKNDWDIETKYLKNLSPYLTIPWLGSSKDTIEGFKTKYPEYVNTTGAKYRVSSSVSIPQVQVNTLTKELKEQFKASEVVFKTDVITKMDSIKTNGIKISKKGLINEPETIMKLYNDYIDVHKDNFQFNIEYKEKVLSIIKNYLSKLQTKDGEFDLNRNITWSIKEFKFDNLFGYGSKNTINFENLNEVVGILGANRHGKSSIIGGIMYTLFNTTDRGSLKNAHIINRNKNDCYGCIRFTLGSTDYIVERRSSRSKKNFEDSSTTVNFWEIKDENGVEIKVSRNGITRDDTDSLIRKKIGTSEDFLLTALASQGNLNRFIDNKATKRKEILNRFLELDIFDYLYDLAKTDYLLLNSQSQQFSIVDLLKFIEKTKKEIEKSEIDLSLLETKIDNLNLKRDELNLWIKSHENIAASIEIASMDNIQKYIDNSNIELESLNNNLKSNKDRAKEIDTNYRLIIKKLSKIDIDKLKDDEKTLIELEKNLFELNKSFDIQNEKLKTNEKAVFKLNVVPCGDQFPTCHFIKDGHEAKQTIEEQKKIVEKIGKNAESSKKLLEKYINLELKEKIKEYNSLSTDKIIAESDIQRINEKIKHQEEKIELLKKEIRSSITKLSSSKKSIDKLESDEFKKKKESLLKVQNELSETNKSKNDLLIKLGGKKSILEKSVKEQNEKKDLIERLKIFESIQSAFSKNGIPAMILKSQMPAINRELSKILDNLVDFSLTFETDINSNTMDIYLNDNKSKRLIEMCSGMEKTICSLAVRVALSNLSSLSRPDILILDEAFGALDEENLQKSIEFLSILKNYFKCILVITHETPIKEIVDKVLEIKNNGFESKIEA